MRCSKNRVLIRRAQQSITSKSAPSCDITLLNRPLLRDAEKKRRTTRTTMGRTMGSPKSRTISGSLGSDDATHGEPEEAGAPRGLCG